MERRGVPTVSLALHRFESAARTQARAMGLPELPIAVAPYEVYFAGSPDEAQEAADKAYPTVLKGLTSDEESSG